MIGETAILSHWIAAGVFAALMVAVLLIGRRSVLTTALAAASAVHAIWAASLAYGIQSGQFLALGLTLGETVRMAAWIGFLTVLGLAGWADEGRNPTRRVAFILLGMVGLQLAVDITLAAGVGISGVVQFASQLLRIAIAVGGLVLVHSLYVSSAPANRWSFIALSIALIGLFAYDVNLLTFQLLDPEVAVGFFEARGIANAVVAPLFLISVVRNRTLKVQLSRQAAVQTFALAAIGVYLVVMAGSGYLLGLFGGEWSLLLQVSFIFAALVFGALVLFSGRARAWARVKISKHFFAYKYDYREEWLRFIATVGRSGPGYGTLKERVVEGVAAIVDAPGGALFERADNDRFDPAARWNFRALPSVPVSFAPETIDAMTAQARILDASSGELELFDGSDAETSRLWLGVPLVHLDELIAVIFLERSTSRRDLDWEDFDILRTVGRQAASYIAEQYALASLEETRKFEEFNRRFAFIMHDIKNLASQLGLLARNAERHADNAEFRADMIETLKSSVGKMNDLLTRLGEGRDESRASVAFDLRETLAKIVKDRSVAGGSVTLDAEPYPLQITGDEAKIEQAVAHIVQNAIDASPTGTPVTVRLRNEAGAISVLVEDKGTGMSAEFVREELFKPFRSTKADGFGIGAYEARELIRGEGGTLDVRSEPGVGTTFLIRFPATAAAGMIAA